MKMHYISALIILFIAFSANSETLEEALQCAKIVRADTVYSSSGRLRADQIFVCVNADSTAVTLHYRTSAMIDAKFTGADHSPWLGIVIRDNTGEILFKQSNFQIANVLRCGGYTGHWKAIPIVNHANDIYSVEVSMGGDNPQLCSPSGWDRVVYDVKRNVSRYLQGEFTEEEKAIIMIGTGGGG